MSALSDSEIKELCERQPPLISGSIDWAQQLQPAGFDLSLSKVFSLNGRGCIRASGRENKLPGKKEVSPSNGLYQLDPGYYLVLFNEIVSLPIDVIGIGKPRSTLIRYGALLNAGIWDPGFQGKSQCGLAVQNQHGIDLEVNCTLLHLTFYRLGRSSSGFAHNHFYRDEGGNFKEI